MYAGSENEIEYKHVAAIIEEETKDKDEGATTSMLRVHGCHFYQVTDEGTNFLKDTHYFELLTMKSSIIVYVEVKESTNTLASSPERNFFHILNLK